MRKGTPCADATAATAALSSSIATGALSSRAVARASVSQPKISPPPGWQGSDLPPNGSLLWPLPPTITPGTWGRQTSALGGLGGTGVQRSSAGALAATVSASARRPGSTANERLAASVHVAGTITSPIRNGLPATPENTIADRSR